MAKILGFVWTSPFEIVFITDCGIELYTVISDKRMLKNIKVGEKDIELLECYGSRAPRTKLPLLTSYVLFPSPSITTTTKRPQKNSNLRYWKP